MRLALGRAITYGGRSTTDNDVVVTYPVLGLPVGQSAQIYDFAGDQGCRIRRVKNGVAGDWQGAYESVEAALAALQAQVDAGR
jgi:hypothetical protein